MKLQIKFSLALLPPMLIVVFIIGLWSARTVSTRMRQAMQQFLMLELDAHVQTPLIEAEALIKKQHLNTNPIAMDRIRRRVLAEIDEIRLDDQGDVILFTPDGHRVHAVKDRFPANLTAWPIIIKNLAGHAGTVRTGHIHTTIGGIDYAGYYFPAWKWIAVYAMSDTAERASLASIRNAAIGLGALGLIMAFCAILFAFRRFVAAPLRTVQHAIAEIEHGAYTTRVPIASRDEIGDLARSIERMADAIGDYRQRQQNWQNYLEAEVCSRTEILKQTNEALEAEIAEREQAEMALLEHERLRGVLEMAGAVCHELNQPLQSITGYTDLLMLQPPEDREAARRIKDIQSQVQRMGRITQKLMRVTQYKVREYGTGQTIIDIDKSAEAGKG